MSAREERQLTFDWGQPAKASPAERPFPAAAALAERLRRLAERKIYLGTSSWKYPGWQGQIYDPARYQIRGQFSERKFNQECLAEYAAVFPAVCGDFAFYQFPTEQSWKELFAQVPPEFRFSLKVPEEVTVERFPRLPRYGKRAGTANAHFMDPALVRDQLLSRLDPYRDRIGVLIFEFGTFHGGPMRAPGKFAEALARLLAGLPLDRYRFAVEVRNREFLGSPGRERYLACLRDHGAAHCLNSWTQMPPLIDQVQIPGVFTAPHVVARLLLRPGRAYQQAVESFAPYDRIQDPYPEGRDALRDLIEACVAESRMLLAFVNNRFEGNAPQTIQLTTEGWTSPAL
ncbi:MAG: DUF72 domain-containing protein [Phycisphaerae bacterium]|nr:DUF72 domain-containing protein [Phycisphaerae bacterium]